MSLPLPQLHFKIQFQLHSNSLSLFDTTISNEEFSFSFTFNAKQIDPAKKFIRLCNFILFRLRNLFFSKLDNLETSDLISPLLRLISEISSEFKNNANNEPFPQLDYIEYYLATDSDPNLVRVDFISFLNGLSEQLLLISQTDIPEILFDLINDVYKRIDIAFCMTQYFVHHFYFLPTVMTPFINLIQFKRLDHKYFINFKFRLAQRVDFCLLKI